MPVPRPEHHDPHRRRLRRIPSIQPEKLGVRGARRPRHGRQRTVAVVQLTVGVAGDDEGAAARAAAVRAQGEFEEEEGDPEEGGDEEGVEEDFKVGRGGVGFAG